MRALIEYTVRKKLRDVSSLTVTVEATALPGSEKTLYINDHNLATLQSIDVCTEYIFFMLLMSFLINIDIFIFCRYLKLGEPLKFKLEVRVMLFYKCRFNIMLILNDSKQNHQ